MLTEMCVKLSKRTHKHTRTDTHLSLFLSLSLHSASQFHLRPSSVFCCSQPITGLRGVASQCEDGEKMRGEKESEELVKRRAFQSYSQRHGGAGN